MSVVVGFKEVGKFVEIYVVGTWVENAAVDKYVAIMPFEDCPKEVVKVTKVEGFRVEGLIVVSIEVVSSVVECNVDNPLVDG